MLPMHIPFVSLSVVKIEEEVNKRQKVIIPCPGMFFVIYHVCFLIKIKAIFLRLFTILVSVVPEKGNYDAYT